MPHLDYRQYQRVRGLVRQCCNNDNGNCLLLDDGWEPCACVQSISRSLVCKHFRAAVLPRPNRGKYCPDCAAAVQRQQKAESEQRRRAERGQLGARKP